MEDAKLKELLNALHSSEMSSYQMEKQCHKWIGHVLKRIHGKFLDDYRAVEVVHQILCHATKNNQIHILAPYVLNWCNDILSRVTQAANPNTYLSILALFLSFAPGPCRQVRRRMWLNLMTFATSPDCAARAKAATILSCASTKDHFCDLYVELLNLMERISPVLIPNGVEIAPPRTISVLSDSLLVWRIRDEGNKNSRNLIGQLDFLCRFIQSHLLYRGVDNFPVEDFLQFFSSASALSEVFLVVSQLVAVLIEHHSAELLAIGSLFSNTLVSLALHSNHEVRQRARELTANWALQTGCLSGLQDRKHFDELFFAIVAETEKCPTRATLRFAHDLVNALGPYLNAKATVRLISAIIKTMIARVDLPDERTIVMFSILTRLVTYSHSTIPTPAIYAIQIAQMYLKSSKSSSEVRNEARTLLSVTERLKRPFHVVRLAKTTQSEFGDFGTGGRETEEIVMKNESHPEQMSMSSNVVEYLERIEAKIDSFQQQRRPSIVQAVQFSRDKIEEPIETRTEENTFSGSDYESDNGQPSRRSSPEVESVKGVDESADSGEESITEDIYKPGPSKMRRIAEPNEPPNHARMADERQEETEPSDALVDELMAKFVDQPAEHN